MIGTDELTDWYLSENREWRQRDQGHTRTGWRASGLGYCLRKQTYSRLGVPELRDIDAQTLRTFSYGDMVHDWAKRIIRTSGLMIAEELRLEDPARDVAGHFDVLFGAEPVAPSEAQIERWSPEYRDFIVGMRARLAEVLEQHRGAVVLGEIKSMSSRALSYTRKEGPRDTHRPQLGAYWSMIQANPDQLEVDPTEARLIYVGKDSVAMQDFEMEQSWIDEADRTLEALNRYWRADELPPCTCDGWMVGYCDYLKPEARTISGKPRSNIKGGVDCCPPELFDTVERKEER